MGSSMTGNPYLRVEKLLPVKNRFNRITPPPPARGKSRLKFLALILSNFYPYFLSPASRILHLTAGRGNYLQVGVITVTFTRRTTAE